LVSTFPTLIIYVYSHLLVFNRVHYHYCPVFSLTLCQVTGWWPWHSVRQLDGDHDTLSGDWVVTTTLCQVTRWWPWYSVRWLGGDHDTLSGDWVVTMTLIRWPPVIWEY